MNFRRSTTLFLSFLMVLGSLGCSSDTEDSNPRTGNLQALGSSARDLLSDEIFTSMIIEVGFVQGFEPSQDALDELESFLNLYTHKPGGIAVVKTAVEVSDNGPYSISK